MVILENVVHVVDVIAAVVAVFCAGRASGFASVAKQRRREALERLLRAYREATREDERRT